MATGKEEWYKSSEEDKREERRAEKAKKRKAASGQDSTRANHDLVDSLAHSPT